MSIKSQLLKLLAQLPKTQTVPERRALLMITGFEHLSAKIDSFEKSNFVFFSELIELIFSEGQAQSLEFLGELANSDWIGLETRNKLNNIIAEVSLLENKPSNSNCEDNHFLVDTPIRRIESLDEQQNKKLIIPSIPGVKSFEFTVVMVDAQGKESSRYLGKSYYLTQALGKGVTLEMVYIPEGKFLMGSLESEGKRYSNERPQHLVEVKPFFISKYPITQAQWKEIASLPEARSKLKLRPSPQGGKSHPVTQISWFDAVELCERLSQSQKIGYKYRLPTEAEWEYACRAGTKTPFHFGEVITSNLANYDASLRQSSRSKPQGIDRKATTPVGSFQFANSFGLFDMHGNVWEWCLDHWHENYHNAPTNGDEWLNNSESQTRVMRGGSLLNDPTMCRSSYRFHQNASERFKHVGFRIVFSLD
jgi:formylglycine-generating enzyme required for sulfatase activity